jgi:outer membrane protein assembly factor BamB
MKTRNMLGSLLGLLLLGIGARYADADPKTTVSAHAASGWRGNGTGLWLEGRPPLTWRRVPRGALDGLRASSQSPHGAAVGDAPLVEKGLLRDWLVLGPLAVGDGEKNFDDDPLGGEETVNPAVGDTVGERAWRQVTAPPDDPMVFGTAELPWLDVGKIVGFQTNQVAYAHTWLYSPRGGQARIVVDHAHGLKVWINGRIVYRNPERGVSLGYYTAISRHELSDLDQPSPDFDLELSPGWNRLLLKISTPSKEGFTDMRFCLRIMDPPDVPYESENIFWMTELPGRSTSTPILVGDCLFVMAEPDELIAIDKSSGQILWTAANNYYEALSADERAAHPALAARVDPLVSQFKQETDRKHRTRLRRQIRETLEEISKDEFAIRADGHFESHFGIVGFTMPTPVSDGKRVYVWCGMGVAACYDLDGHRQWIKRVPTGDLTYGSSPALADGVLGVYLNRLYGLDAETGEVLWEQPRVHKNVAAILAAPLAGQSVFVTQQGEVVRPSDGELLFRPRGIGTGDTGWSPPVILGNVAWVPRYGVASLTPYDFSACTDDIWTPEMKTEIKMPDTINRLENGGWIDRWTAGSPLIWQGLSYQVDIYGVLYVGDVATGGMVYRQPLKIQGLMHYNAVPVAASPTLVGEHVLVMDNQGNTLVIRPGRGFKLVANNSITTQLPRTWPIPAQETLAYAPPIVDGNRMYIRGERYLYCVGKD